MYNSMQNDEFYTVPKKSSTSQSSNMARYGKIGVLGDIKPSTLTMSNIKYGQSLTDFQSQLSRMAGKQQFRIKKKYLQRNKRAYTQIQNQTYNDDQIYTQKLSGRTSTIAPVLINTKGNDSTKQLHQQLQQIKRMIQQQRKVNSIQARFEKLYQQIQKKNSQQLQQPQPFYNPYNQFPMMYPPPNYMYNQPSYHHYPPQYDNYSNKTSHRKRKQSQSDVQSNYTIDNRKNSRNQSSRLKSTTNPLVLKKPTMKLNRNWATHMLKKYFYAVTFMSFLKKESKKMALIRKTNLRKFWLQKFSSQVTNMKNWLLQTMKYALSIILQKKQLNFDFFTQKRQKVKKQKQKLVLQLVYLCVQQMKKLSNPKDVSLFGQILVIVCQNGSFPISRFWTINQMQKLRISEYYGFIRADEWTEKMMILMFVFMKVLIFNMLLQPYKFDSINFTKTSQPLLSNMFLLASILYHIVKEVIQQYLNQPKKHQMYEPGNWLKVKKQFISQCCQPLVFNSDQYQKGEFISGMLQKEMFNQMLQDQQNYQKWEMIRQKIRNVIDSLYVEMRAKGKMLKSNIKFKMYN